MDFTRARDDGVAARHQLDRMQIICILLESRQITMPVPPHHSVYRQDALPATHPTAQSTESSGYLVNNKIR